MMIDPVINGFSTNEVRRKFQIYDHSIITFGERRFHLGFSNNSRVDSLEISRKLVVENPK